MLSTILAFFSAGLPILLEYLQKKGSISPTENSLYGTAGQRLFELVADLTTEERDELDGLIQADLNKLADAAEGDIGKHDDFLTWLKSLEKPGDNG
jgi:hypothetical protein